jgi:hypothetical protein
MFFVGSILSTRVAEVRRSTPQDPRAVSLPWLFPIITRAPYLPD